MIVGRCISYWNSPFLGGHVIFLGCNLQDLAIFYFPCCQGWAFVAWLLVAAESGKPSVQIGASLSSSKGKTETCREVFDFSSIPTYSHPNSEGFFQPKKMASKKSIGIPANGWCRACVSSSIDPPALCFCPRFLGSRTVGSFGRFAEAWRPFAGPALRPIPSVRGSESLRWSCPQKNGTGNEGMLIDVTPKNWGCTGLMVSKIFFVFFLPGNWGNDPNAMSFLPGLLTSWACSILAGFLGFGSSCTKHTVA